MSEGNSLDVGALVQECIERVIGRGSRAEAALELHRLGVTSRGSVRTRGSVAEAAPGRFPVPAKTRKLVEALSDSDAATRRHVIAALGEWGGTEAAGAIVSHLRSEQDEETRLYAITALRTIGGPNAVEGLRRFVENGTETERDLALSALEELATGGSIEDTEAPITSLAALSDTTTRMKETLPSAKAVRTRGSLRTRGAVRVRAMTTGPADTSVADTLEQLRDCDEGASTYIRLKAGRVLRHFSR